MIAFLYFVKKVRDKVKPKSIWLSVLVIFLLSLAVSCVPRQTETPQERESGHSESKAESSSLGEVPEELGEAAGEGGCPAVTMADRKGVPPGKYERFYELGEYEAAAGCKMAFKENPDIAELNRRIANNPDLPPVEKRLPIEPLVVVPYESTGKYGGEFHATSNATEAGTADFLSVRHVNLVRFGDDYKTIEPDVAKSWEWNDDYTELIFHLRQGHKWSDGGPFTSADVAFWMEKLIMNPDIYPNTPSWTVLGGEPIKVELIDDTTFKFVLPVPTPGMLGFFATTHIQPWQPKHFFEKKMQAGMSLTEAADVYYGYSDWKDVPSPLLNGESEDVVPTLESFILVEETTEGRHFVANPYFFMVDTAGNQLPYFNEQDEVYIPDQEVRNLKITNGEVDYKIQSIFIDDYPLYKENEYLGDYTADLVPAVGQTQYYSFNLTHPDEELRKIFNDLRFRQAMSLAINRAEIAELVYLGQGEPMQYVPADHNTVDFVQDDHLNAFIVYDPGRANALLDEMGLVDVDSDSFRERLDGEKLTLDLQFANQGGPTASHELVKDYWEDVGIKTQIKEVTSDEYRQRANANQAEVLTWKSDGTPGAVIVLNTDMILPPFGDNWNPGGAIGWAEWVNSDGASGIKPPADTFELYEVVAEFLQHELGSPESSVLGEKMVAIHVDNLWKIGVVGDVRQPVIHHNRLRNFGLPQVMVPDYRWVFPLIPQQWYLEQ